MEQTHSRFPVAAHLKTYFKRMVTSQIELIMLPSVHLIFLWQATNHLIVRVSYQISKCSIDTYAVPENNALFEVFRVS
jgi:hypothetical protein